MAQIPFVAFLHTTEHRRTSDFSSLEAVHFALDNGATVEQNLNLNVASLGLIQFQTQDSDVDLAAKSLKLHPSRPLTQAVATCIGERGRTVEEVQIDLSNPTEPVVQWSTSDEVVKVVVNAQDEHGFSAVLELTPWHYSIPHEDVVFATGQDAITAEEAPKLEKAWTDIVDVLDRYGSVVVIKLYVAGYTDTVGDAGGTRGCLSAAPEALQRGSATEGSAARSRSRALASAVRRCRRAMGWTRLATVARSTSWRPVRLPPARTCRARTGEGCSRRAWRRPRSSVAT